MALTFFQGGLIADGSGTPAISGNLLVEDDRIVAVGDVAQPPHCVTIDCRSLVVAPGFIDLHSHSDLQVIENRTEKADQGVTTEVVGNCGFSAYPGAVHPDAVREFANGILCGSGAWAFRNARDYLAAVATGSKLVNVRSLVGHGSLRVGLFGNRQDRLTGAELDQMQGVLDDALTAGACGFSTGLMYAPGSGAPSDELEALCRIVKRRDALYATHMRSYSFGLIEATEEQLELARNTGCRLQISHLQAAGQANWDKQRRALDKIETARREGIDVEFDIYPYQAGSTVMTQLLPQWTLDGGIARLLALLGDPGHRRRIGVEANAQIAQRWSDILVTSVASASNQSTVGKTLEDIAKSRGVEPMEAVMDLISEEHGAVNIISFNQSDENLRELLTHPLCSVISDGFYVKGRPHPRLYGTFPSLLGLICRERRWMDLPEAIHKITAKPASRLRIGDRGWLRPGAVADVTVFDPETVGSAADYNSPEVGPTGIRSVFRSGKPFSVSGAGGASC